MKAGKLWPLAIAGVLVVTVLANVWLLWSASDENAAVVEPDYYRKALDYDSTIAQEQANNALDWKIDMQTYPVTRDGQAAIQLRIADAAGTPLSGADVQITGIHNLDAARRPHVRLVETDDATYSGSLTLQRPGFWELRVEIVHGHDRFTQSLRRDVPYDPRPDTGGS